ncbi:9990_t:CDS:1, partial [Funneliformis geosporum]
MSIWKKHSNSKLNAKVCYIRGRLGESGISEFETLHRYDNFFQNLTDLKAEINLEIAKGRKKNNEDKRYFCLYCGIGLTEDEFVVKTCSKEE